MKPLGLRYRRHCHPSGHAHGDSCGICSFSTKKQISRWVQRERAAGRKIYEMPYEANTGRAREKRRAKREDSD